MDHIVFIHGLGGGSKKTWGKFPQLIESDPLFGNYKIEYYSYQTSLIKINPFSVYPKIQELANGLRTFINNRTDKSDKVLLVAHSMGGLIARKYLVDEIKNKRRINSKKLLLYSTPNQGSQLAQLFWLSRVVHVFQMRKKADFIRELNDDWKVLNVDKYIHVKFVLAGKDRIVDSDSAKNYWNSNDIDVVPEKRHKNIVKPSNAEDDSYLIFKSFVIQRYKFLIEDYEKPKVYVTRKVIDQTNFNNIYFNYIKNELELSLFDAVLKFQTIALLAGAGEGKTKEVENLVWMSSTSNLMIYPIKANLRFYTGGAIKDIFPVGWDSIPDDQLLIVLDGLDEVESSNIKSVIKSIEYFVEQHPKTRILITCRTNFYLTPNDNFSGTIKGFGVFYLLRLDWDDIKDFLSIYLKNKREDFLTKLADNKLEEIVRIPFYLISLVKYYDSRSTLPANIISMFNWLIETRLTEDIEHFRTTFDLANKKNEIIAALEKIALTMESLGRNYAFDDEIDKVLKTVEEKKLLSYSGIIIKKENKWEFEHNNFQEFLAAKLLAQNNLEIIKKFIAFEPDFTRVIPSWTNTLSFLSTLYLKNDLLNWLYESQPEMLVKFERDRIPPELRYEIFVKIFSYYKQRRIWIDNDKYGLIELGKIASDTTSIAFLINEAETEQDNIIRANAIMMLGFVENLESEKREQIKNLLLKLISENKAENLVTKSISALNNLAFHDVETINQIIKELDGCSNAHIRSCIYNIIQASKTSDVFVDFLLNGVKFIRTNYKEGKGSTLIDESYYLEKGLEQIESKEAIIKMLDYFIINPRDLSEVSLRRTASSFAKNISTHIVKKDEKIFDLSFQLILALGKKYFLEYTKEFIHCFKLSSTELKAFKKAIEEKIDVGIKYNILSLIASKECIDFVIEKYDSTELLSFNFGLFRNFLGGSNPELKKYLDERLKNETSFVFPNVIDYESQRIQQRKRELEMFFSKDIFFNEIGLLFEKEQKEVFTEEEIHNMELKNWETPIYANKALDIIRTYSQKNEADINSITRDYEKADFEYLFITEVYNRLKHNEEFELEEKYIEKIKKWCYDKVDEINFRKALLVLPGRQFQTNTYALYTGFFMRKFDLNYSENILLDMLSYSWHGVGIEYVATKLDQKKIVRRIIENLKANDENEIAIQNYFAYGLKNKIKDFISYGREYLGNVAFDISTRTTVLDYLTDLDNSDDGIENALGKTNDEFKWKIVEKLLNRNNKNIKRYLLGMLEDGGYNDKLMASQYLIEMQEIEGLKYFSNKIKADNEFKLTWFRDHNALKTLIIKEAIPYLLEMLELTYHKGFRQMEYDRLELKIFDSLSNIALQSDDNYHFVKSSLEKFIKEKEQISENIRFINSFLDRLERSFYINKSQDVTIEDALEKLKLLLN